MELVTLNIYIQCISQLVNTDEILITGTMLICDCSIKVVHCFIVTWLVCDCSIRVVDCFTVTWLICDCSIRVVDYFNVTWLICVLYCYLVSM